MTTRAPRAALFPLCLAAASALLPAAARADNTPTGVVFDEISTHSITASGYAATPAFADLETGLSGVNVAVGPGYAYGAWRNGNVWTTKAAMPTARQYLAVAVMGGKAYFVGGNNGSARVQNEEYDPAANSWTTKAAMPIARQQLIAAVIGGKAYFVGGWNGSVLVQNEEYDPAANSWTTKAAMPTARWSPAAAVMGGKAYVVGGSNVSSRVQNEEYDPATNSWTTKAAMPTARQQLIAAVMGSKAYVVGGENGSNLAQNEEYDPAANSWTTKAAMPTARYAQVAAVMGGKAYIVGGYNGSGNYAVNEEYDPASNAWTTRAAMPAARRSHAAAVIGGKAYFVGGTNGSNLAINEEYDPGVSQSFAGLTPNTQYSFKAKARDASAVETAESVTVSTYTLAAASAPPAGTALVTAITAAGMTVNWSSGTQATGYNGAGASYVVQASSYTDFTQIAGSETVSGSGNTAATLGGLTTASTYYFRVKGINSIGQHGDYFYLGSSYKTEAPTNIVFDEISTAAITASAYAATPAFTRLSEGQAGINVAKDGAYAGWRQGDKWTTKAAMPTGRMYLAAVAVGGKAYFVGGWAPNLALNEEYDPATNSWTTKAAMPTARNQVNAVAVGGKAYVVGGWNGSFRNQNEEYDPATNSWTTRAAMPTARYAQVAAVVGGKAYFVGGWNGSVLVQNEEYDPATNSWTTKAAMPTGRGSTGVAVLGGKAYFVGGSNGSNLAQNEAYDPATNSWTTKAAMPTARHAPVAAVMGGKAYFVGGSNGSFRNQNEEYDPVANTWTTKAAMPTARYAHVAVMGGKAYFVGGYEGSTLIVQNEEYDPGVAQSFSGLLPNTQYSFKAKARSPEGFETAESVTVSTYTLATASAPPAGTALVSAITATGMTVNWSSGTAATGYNGAGASYVVQASSYTDFTLVAGSETVSGSGNTAATLGGLTTAATYYFRVKGINSIGQHGDYFYLGSSYKTEVPTNIVFDEISTAAITASAYAATPAFTRLGEGQAGINVARDGTYAGWRSGDKWTTRAAMPTARYNIGAAVVGGKAYVVGGFNGSNLAKNEEYDPVANIWTTKAAMPTARWSPAAAVMGGKVYLVGGYNGVSNLVQNEEYDPAANSWTTKTAMPTARNAHAAAVVGGKAYFTGGNNGTGRNQNEEYDPAANSWTTKAAMPTARYAHAAAVMGGKAYFVGGGNGSYLVQNEEYDPAANNWTTKAPMPTTRAYLGSAVIGGKASVVGGSNGSNLAKNEEYDPAANSWTTKAEMSTARNAPAAAVMGGKAYFAGGSNGSNLAQNEEYDPGTAQSFAGLLPNTQYAFKAKARSPEGFETAESPTISTYTLAVASGPPAGTALVTAITAAGMTVNWSSGTSATGYNGAGASYVVEASSYSTFSLIAGSETVSGNTAATLGGLTTASTYYFRVKGINSIGQHGDYFYLGSSYKTEAPTGIVFDDISTFSITASAYAATPAFTRLSEGQAGVNVAKDGAYAGWKTGGDKWTARALMPTVRDVSASAVMGGKIYIVGGRFGASYMTQNEEYDPVANSWATRAAMPTGRRVSGTAVVGGKAYFVGGTNGSNLAQNEEYDPAANSWTTKAAMPTARSEVFAVAVGVKIYLAGGWSGSYIATNEEYDPAANSWTTKAAMPTGRGSTGVAVLGGKAYFVGGYNGSYRNLNEEYDPAVNSWTTKAARPTTGASLSAAAIGGKVYCVGGEAGAGDKSQNEEYDPATNGWTTKASMPTARSSVPSAVVGGKAYFVGGFGGSNANQEYDPGVAQVFSGLTPNTQYSFKAKARSPEGVETAESPTISTYTLAVASGPPAGTALVTAITAAGMTVNWSSGTSATGYNGAGASYVVEASSYSTFSLIAGSETVTGSGNTAATLGGLTTASTYYFRVKGINSIGQPNPDFFYLGSAYKTEVPTNIVFDEISTAAITASAYAATPAFTRLGEGQAGINVARDGAYAGWRQGDKWTTKAAMPTARQYHAAAVIGGKAYFVGGTNGSNLAQNEEYDPAANSWTTKAAMPTARSYYAAAAAGGKAYFVGGNNGSYKNQNEEYDPAANSWTTKAAMPTTRDGLAAAAVGGKAYFVGGYNGSYRNQNEEYDPATNSWTTKAPIPTERSLSAFAAVGGKAYVVGGTNGTVRNQNEEYDPAANTWATKAAMPTARRGLAIAAAGGKAYVMGGTNGSNLSQNEEYDPGANSWATKAAMSTARDGLAVMAIGGKAYFVGGYNGSYRNQNEEYDPGTAQSFAGLIPNTQYSFKAKARSPEGIETSESPTISTYTLATASAPPAGTALVTAITATGMTVNWSSGTQATGYNGAGASYVVEASSYSTFSLIAGSETVSGSGNTAATVGGLTTAATYYFRVKGINSLNQHGDYFYLGSSYKTEAPTNIVFDEISTAAITASAYAATPAFTRLSEGQAGINVAKDGAYAGWRQGDKWTTKAAMPTARQYHAAAVMGGKAYFVGGTNGSNLAQNEEYDPAANSWTTKAAMPTMRFLLTSAVMGGKAYFVGGYNGSGNYAVNEEYDPVANSWTTKAAMPTVRRSFAAAAAGGKAYFAGGFNGSALNQNEEYDPAADSWATKAAMPTARWSLPAAAVIGGKAYVVGGWNGSYRVQNEEYDPAANNWTTKAAIPTARSALGAAVVGGKAYFVGGDNGSNLAQNEEYDPAANSWATKAAMSTARNAHAAAVVGGKAYFAGGSNGSNLAQNEEYDPGTAQSFAGLLPNTQYAFKAKARSPEGFETAESVTVSTYTLAAAGAPPSGTPVFAAVYLTSAAVNWSSGTASGGYNAPGASYRLEASTRSDFNPVAAAAVVAAPDATLEGLTSPSTAYYFRVRAINSAGRENDAVLLGSTVTWKSVDFTAADAAPAGVYQSSEAAVLRLSLRAAPGQAGIFSALRVKKIGTAADSDVSLVKVYKDADASGTFSADADLVLAQSALSAGAADVAFGANVQALSGTPQIYFVVYRLAELATAGATLGARVELSSHVALTSPLAPSGAFPIDSGLTAVADSASVLTLTGTSLAPAVVVPGAVDVGLLKIRAMADVGAGVIDEMVVYLTGTLASNRVSALKVWRDADADGAFDPAADSLVNSGSDVFASGVSTVVFTASQSSRTVTADPADYFISVNLSASADLGATFGVKLAAASEVRLGGALDTVSFTATPLASGETLVSFNNVVTASLESQAPATLTQGVSYAVMKATLTVDAGSAQINRLKVNRTGVGADADVAAVKVYRDVTADGGAYNPAVDVFLGSAPFSAGVATVDIATVTLNAGTTSVLFVVYDVSPTANPGDTLGAGMTSDAYMRAVSAYTTIAGNFPFSGALGTVAAAVNTLQVQSQDMTTGGLLQGATNVALIKLTVRADANVINWSALSVDRLGTGSDADVSAVKVFYDSNADGALQSGSDELLASAAFSGGAADLAFGSVQAVAASTRAYFVAASIANDAATGGTFGVRISSTSDYNVNSPNRVSTSAPSYPIDAGPVGINQYPNLIAVSTLSVAPAAAANPGTANIAVEKLTLRTDVSQASWTSLKLDRTGTSADADVASVKIYYDINGQGSFNAANLGLYQLVTSTTATFGSQGPAGTVSLTLTPAQALTTTPKAYFAVIDLSTSAAPAKTVTVRAVDKTYFAVNAPNSVSPVSFSAGAVTVATPPSFMEARGASSAPASAVQGTAGVPLLTFKVWMRQYTGSWSGLSVSQTGDAADADVLALKLYYDDDADGAFDPAFDVLAATGTFSGGVSAMGFLSAQSVTTSTKTYFLTCDVSPTAEAGATISARLSAAGAFTVASPHSVAGTFPIQSTALTVTPTQNGVYVASLDRAPGSLAQASTGQVMLSLTMNTTSNAVLLSGLTVKLLGTAADSDIARLRVLDGDTLAVLATADNPFTSGLAVVSLSPAQTVSTLARPFLIDLDMANFADYAKTAGVRVEAATSLSVPSPNYIVDDGFPMDSSVVAIAKIADVMTALPASLLSAGVIQGAEVPVAKLSVWASREKASWDRWKLARLGSLADNLIDEVRIYKDADGDGAVGGLDVLIGTGTFSSGNATVNFSSAQTVTLTTASYIAAYKLNINATVGATLGAAMADAATLRVASPDSVSGANLPFQTALVSVLDAKTPVQPVVALPDGSATKDFDSVHFAWLSSVALGSISSAAYAVGTSPGAADVLAWQSLPPTSTDVKAYGLSLSQGGTYYISVKATSSYGFTSAAGVSPALLVDMIVPGKPAAPSVSEGQAAVNVSWQAVAAGPSGVLGYLVEYRKGESPLWYNAKTSQVSSLSAAAFGVASSTSNYVAGTSLAASNLPNGTVFLRVSAVSSAGAVGPASEAVRILLGAASSSLEDASNYPNPFDARKESTNLYFSLDAAGDVKITILDIYGRRVKSVSFGGVAGGNNWSWDGADETGRKVAMGVYLCVIEASSQKQLLRIGVMH